jgi:hypothetical protein
MKIADISHSLGLRPGVKAPRVVLVDVDAHGRVGLVDPADAPAGEPHSRSLR